MGLSPVNLDDSQHVLFDDTGRSPAYFCQMEPVGVDQQLLQDLKKNAARLGDRDLRLCLHDNPEAAFHEMINLQHRHKYHAPHKHPAIGESYHVLEGTLAVFIFDDDGGVTDSILLKPDGIFLYRVPPVAFHFMMPVSDIAIYKESKLGPFRRDRDTMSAPWAPIGTDRSKLLAYGHKLLETLIPPEN